MARDASSGAQGAPGPLAQGDDRRAHWLSRFRICWACRLPLWTVLTAIILTQANFGRSVKATLDYLVGTVGGAIYAGAVSVLVPHNSELSLAGVLALAVAPLAFLGALNPSFGSAPFTGALVLLVPGLAHVGPIESAVDRVLEVAIGGSTALAVSLLVFPARAHSHAIEAAARALDLMARSLPDLFAGFWEPHDPAAYARLQDSVGQAVAKGRGGRRGSETRADRRFSRPSRSWGLCCGPCCGSGTTWS